jgi:hypothetical protein
MGEDLYAHWEIKIDGVWHNWSAMRFTRNYALHYALNGYSKEGLPDDVTLITRLHSQILGDNYGFSWMNIDELEKAIADVEVKESRELALRELGRILCMNYDEFKSNQPQDVEDVRFIYWYNF